MVRIQNWLHESVEVARSSGGIPALVNPWNNVIRTGVRSWPGPS